MDYKAILGISLILILGTYLLYHERNRIYFQTFGDDLGSIYYNLHYRIINSKGAKDYSASEIIYGYFDSYHTLPKESNREKWEKAKEFWTAIYLDFPDELISKLETKIELNDIGYFKKLKYSKHPKSIQTEVELREIYSKIKSQAITWAKTSRKREQSVRLGYFVIKAGFLIPKDDNQESWLEVWNAELKDSIEKPLTVIDLIKNPWSKGADRSDISIENNMQKIELQFYRIGWKRGIELIENGIDQ